MSVDIARQDVQIVGCGRNPVKSTHSIYENPNAVQNMLLTGMAITLTDHVDLYVDLYAEWVHQRVDRASLPGRDGHFFNGIERVINWHF